MPDSHKRHKLEGPRRVKGKRRRKEKTTPTSAVAAVASSSIQPDDTTRLVNDGESIRRTVGIRGMRCALGATHWLVAMLFFFILHILQELNIASSRTHHQHTGDDSSNGSTERTSLI